MSSASSPGAAPRKLVGRSLHTLNSLNSPASSAASQPQNSLEDAKHLLLMSQLPPGLSISGGHVAQFPGLGHSPLGRTVSDGLNRKSETGSWSLSTLSPAQDSGEGTLASLSRRKLESEDSSYDSDHEALVGQHSTGVQNRLSPSLSSLSVGPQLSKSHEDVSRTYSETLAQVRI